MIRKKELSDLEDEIDQTQDNLEAAKQQSASQYEDMKIRIRYMYENGNTPMLEMLLSASSFLISEPDGVYFGDQFV